MAADCVSRAAREENNSSSISCAMSSLIITVSPQTNLFDVKSHETSQLVGEDQRGDLLENLAQLVSRTSPNHKKVRGPSQPEPLAPAFEMSQRFRTSSRTNEPRIDTAKPDGVTLRPLLFSSSPRSRGSRSWRRPCVP